MVQIPVYCPKCKSWMSPVAVLSLRTLINKLLGRILYECEECHWQGYIVFKERTATLIWVLIGIVVLVLLIALAK